MSDQNQKTVAVIGKRRYETPRLMTYGTLAVLTQKSQSGVTDSSGNSKS